MIVNNFTSFLNSLEIYDWITLIYIIIGIIVFIWSSLGNGWVWKKVDKHNKVHNFPNKKCDIYFDEMRKSWLREQNIWKSVELFLMVLAYLSMVITIYITVDNIVSNDFMKIKISFYTIINLLSTALKDYLQPEKKSIGFREAYILINTAILKFENGLIDELGLIEAIADGEKIITKYTYDN